MANKMISHDLVRVFKGVGLVVDHLVLINKSGLKDKISRAQFHAGELMKVAMEIRGDISNGNDYKGQDSGGNHQSHNYNVDETFSAAVSPTTTSHPLPTATNAATSTAPVVATMMPPAMPVIVTPIMPSAITQIHQPMEMPTTSNPSSISVMTGSIAASTIGDEHISIPISIRDFSAMNHAQTDASRVDHKSEKPEDLIGFEPIARATSPGDHTKQGGVRDGNTVINGVKTSSMRERAVPATQLVR